MKKIVIIICYFGNLPDYYKIWESSALKNNTIDFLIFTDQKTIKSKKNILVNYTTLTELKDMAQEKFCFKISLDSPYKLCDYKPAYGYIFNDYIKKYDFWGYCDIDLIFGNIRKFITEDILKNNDIILNLGHLTLYKNTDYYKELFKEKGSIYSYKKVYSSKENFAFDEMSGMHLIFENNNIFPYLDIPIADIDRRYSRFILDNGINFDEQFFFYDDGVKRKYKNNGKVVEDEFCYLHFQKKKPNILTKNFDCFLITKEGFLEYDSKKEFNINKIISVEDEKKELLEYKKNMIKKFLKCNLMQKRIWIKQKISSKWR